MYYIGTMSGTSMDAVDIAIVDIDQTHLDVVYYKQSAFDDDLRLQLKGLNAGSSIEAISILDIKLAHVFADAIVDALEKTNITARDVRAIGHHGQTILHVTDRAEKSSWQIGDANTIAYKTNIDTVADFRRMDIAAGGQGAPLAPAFHACYFRSHAIDRVIINVGGIANMTILPADHTLAVQGFDTGPGNGLLDDWNYQNNGTAMDKNSAWANTGNPDETLLSHLSNDDYFKLPPPKSTGRDYFNLDWLNNYFGSGDEAMNAANVQATLLALSILTISEAINKHAKNCEEVYLCGGGTHNKGFVQKLRKAMKNIEIGSTRNLGIDPDAVEAIAFAWLAYCRVNNIAVELKTISGAGTNTFPGAVYLHSNKT